MGKLEQKTENTISTSAPRLKIRDKKMFGKTRTFYNCVTLTLLDRIKCSLVLGSTLLFSCFTKSLKLETNSKMSATFSERT